MNRFTKHTGRVVAIDRANIDTDQIIPKQFLKRIERTGYGKFLFYDWRFDEAGDPINNFPLNEPRNQGATILLAGANFGCGSSREHAAWSLLDHGFRAVIATSFGDIFYGNSLKNGLLPIRQPQEIVEELVQRSHNDQGLTLTIDLEAQKLVTDGMACISFDIEPFSKYCLLNGLDDIALTLLHEPKIAEFEAAKIADRIA